MDSPIRKILRDKLQNLSKEKLIDILIDIYLIQFYHI